MSFAKHGLTAQSVDLGKAVLALSALGIFAKLLHIDLSQLQVLGVTLGPTTTALIPGFIGLALFYAFIAFVVSRLEAAIENVTDKETVESYKKVQESKFLLGVSLLALPLSVFVYSMPYILGVFAISLLWSDSMSVVSAIWQLATT
ncbi:MAG: hypothetical protein WA056_14920 [Gallionella sp.]